ncbi:esterase/lipase family protein [Adhaeretor mobilis]|uniref:Alpha/beta hydrolase family protein n=1 Tax=Adhaeretor mobilis TaxID=1930276 RepID=A0A517MQ43_9BACT|nr:alpha/beta fold hydrolase [Adhaeretor mobilis]QDS96999.1 Alpha/beta hydrolase family protein [Adhaeretor mobilis]
MDESVHRFQITQRLLVVAVCAVLVVGCSVAPKRTQWHPLAYTAPNGDGIGNWGLIAAEDSYLAAVDLEAKNCPDCVEEYLKTACKAWEALDREIASKGKSSTRAVGLYQSSVAKLIVTGQRFGRWDPNRGLIVASSCGTTLLPTCYHGFNWSPDQFQHLEPVGEYSTPAVSTAYRSTGLGVPLVVSRNVINPQPFTQQEQSFAATALVRFCKEQASYQLEFYDPLRESDVQLGRSAVSLVRDLSAPIAYESLGGDREWLNDFLQPGATGSGDGLFMIEPYQSGKIPVIFVHGLLSDPKTWTNLVNELRARPDLNARFQWWGFRYSTGEPFLTSAAVLRRQLHQIRSTYDPQHQDPAFSQIVLVGHSMGGNVAKLQVTSSGDQLWQSIARIPLGALVTTEETRRDLHQSFFFQPSHDVKRVVFIGTPHAGSSWARRPIGRLGSMLVETDASTEATHTQLIRDNPDVFTEEFAERFPTSIDLLEPESALLASTTRLPYSPWVKLHSIIGTGKNMRDGEPADGVVPVASARLLGVASEILVDAKHESLHREPSTTSEVIRILRVHLANCGVFPPSRDQTVHPSGLDSSQNHRHLEVRSAQE